MTIFSVWLASRSVRSFSIVSRSVTSFPVVSPLETILISGFVVCSETSLAGVVVSLSRSRSVVTSGSSFGRNVVCSGSLETPPPLGLDVPVGTLLVGAELLAALEVVVVWLFYRKQRVSHYYHRHLRDIDRSLAIVGGPAALRAMALNPGANQYTGPAFGAKAFFVVAGNKLLVSWSSLDKELHASVNKGRWAGPMSGLLI